MVITSPTTFLIKLRMSSIKLSVESFFSANEMPFTSTGLLGFNLSEDLEKHEEIIELTRRLSDVALAELTTKLARADAAIAKSKMAPVKKEVKGGIKSAMISAVKDELSIEDALSVDKRERMEKALNSKNRVKVDNSSGGKEQKPSAHVAKRGLVTSSLLGSTHESEQSSELNSKLSRANRVASSSNLIAHHTSHTGRHDILSNFMTKAKVVAAPVKVKAVVTKPRPPLALSEGSIHSKKKSSKSS